MSMNRQVAEQIAGEMKTEWGGRFPTWQEFKTASSQGRVQVSKTVAAQTIMWKPVPAPFKFLYGFVTVWAGFLAVPAAIVLWLLFDVSAWWIPGALIVGWFLIKVSREGHCDGIKVGAENDEAFYRVLVENGAFWFAPEG